MATPRQNTEWFGLIDTAFDLDQEQPFVSQMVDQEQFDSLVKTERKGGAGSGNFGHAGRPGLRGGSADDQGLLDYNNTVNIVLTPTGQEINIPSINWNKVSKAWEKAVDWIEELHPILENFEIWDDVFHQTLEMVVKPESSTLGTFISFLKSDNSRQLRDVISDMEGFIKDKDVAGAVTLSEKLLVLAYQAQASLNDEQYRNLVNQFTSSMESLSRSLGDDPDKLKAAWLASKNKKGGVGSGNYGHAGRPGLVGGSVSAHGASFSVDSRAKYKRADGTYDPKHAKLHKQWIEDDLKVGIKRDEGIVYFLGGGPAAGKSSAIIDRLEAEGTLDGVPRIDPDEYKYRHPDYISMKEEGDPSASSFVHEETSEVSKIAMEEGQKRGFNMLMDSTGDNSIENLQHKIDRLRANGAKTINAEYVFVHDIDKAVQRSKEREAKTGRRVFESLLRKTHRSVAKVFPEALKRGLFDTAKLWNTDTKDQSILTATYDKKNGLKIVNKELWNKFLGVGK